MQKLLVLFLCILIVLGACFWLVTRSYHQDSQTHPKVGLPIWLDWARASQDARQYRIDFDQIEAAVANGAKLYDVRGLADYQLAHFRGAENWPLQELERGNLPLLTKTTPLYLHCQSGKRSAQAAKILKAAGFQHVYDLGGWDQVEAIGGAKSPL